MKARKIAVPSAEEKLDGIVRATILSKLDLFAGYWQIRLAEHVHETATFTGKYETVHFALMFFGLMNAPKMFQRLATEVFDD